MTINTHIRTDATVRTRFAPLTPTIIIDTREPDSGGWEPYFTVPTVRVTLATGDYSIIGCEDFISIERKTLDDLVECLCQSRERFVKELRRFQAISDRWIICEGSYGQLFKGDFHSRMNRKAAWESAIALMTRYKIPVLMADSMEAAAALCESLLLRWFKEHVKIIETVEKAVREIRKAG